MHTISSVWAIEESSTESRAQSGSDLLWYRLEYDEPPLFHNHSDPYRSFSLDFRRSIFLDVA